MRRNAIRNCQVKSGKTRKITKGKQAAIKKSITTRRRKEWNRLFEKYNSNSDENGIEVNCSTDWDNFLNENPRSPGQVDSLTKTTHASNVRAKTNKSVIKNEGDNDGQSVAFSSDRSSPSGVEDEGAPVKRETIRSMRNRSFQTYMNLDHPSKNSGVLFSFPTRRNEFTEKNENVVEDEVQYRLHSEDRLARTLEKEDSDGGNFTLQGTVVSSPNKTGVMLSLKCENGGVLQGFTYFPENLSEDESEHFIPDDLPSKQNKTTKNTIKSKIKKEQDSDDQCLVAHSPFSNSVDEGLPENGGVKKKLFQSNTNLPQQPSEEDFMFTDQRTKRNDMTAINKNNNISKDDMNKNISNSCSKIECKQDEKKQISFSYFPESVRRDITEWNVEFSDFIRHHWNYFRKNPGSVLFPLPKIKSSRKIKRLDWQSIMDGTCEIE